MGPDAVVGPDGIRGSDLESSGGLHTKAGPPPVDVGSPNSLSCLKLAITCRQRVFIDKLIETGDVTVAQHFAGESAANVRKWFGYRPFAEFVAERLEAENAYRSMSKESLVLYGQRVLEGKLAPTREQIAVWTKLIALVVHMDETVNNRASLSRTTPALGNGMATEGQPTGQWDVVPKGVQ